MNEHDNFCLADSMARANGWSLGQQWGFAAFMNDCDRAAQAQKTDVAAETQRIKVANMLAAVDAQLRKVDKLIEELDKQGWTSAEMIAALKNEQRKTDEMIEAVKREKTDSLSDF